MWVLCFFVKHFLIYCCKKLYSQATCMHFHSIHCSYTYMTCVQDVNMFVPMIKHSYLVQYILFSQVAVLLKEHYRQCHIVCAWRWQSALSVSNHNTLIVHFSLSIYCISLPLSSPCYSSIIWDSIRADSIYITARESHIITDHSFSWPEASFKHG